MDLAPSGSLSCWESSLQCQTGGIFVGSKNCVKSSSLEQKTTPQKVPIDSMLFSQQNMEGDIFEIFLFCLKSGQNSVKFGKYWSKINLAVSLKII